MLFRADERGRSGVNPPATAPGCSSVDAFAGKRVRRRAANRNRAWW